MTQTGVGLVYRRLSSLVFVRARYFLRQKNTLKVRIGYSNFWGTRYSVSNKLEDYINAKKGFIHPCFR